jgi:hypothetical protein
MSFLYRFAITITRKQPYIDWANSLDDGGVELTAELARAQRTIYLAPESTAEAVLEELLDEFWEQIFEEELDAWTMNDERWPLPLTREMFDAWFDADVSSTVVDLTPDEPLTQLEVERLDLAEAVHNCASCGAEVEEGAGRFVGFKLADRERFQMREGLTVPLRIDDERVVLGIMTTADSDEARSGQDLVFRACTSRCEKVLRSTVPKALRKAYRSS